MDRNRRLCRKRYETWQQLLWFINFRNLQVADRTMVVIMTLSDLKRREANGQTFPANLRNYTCTVWHRETKLSVVTHVGKEHFYRVRHASYPKKVRSQCHQIFGNVIHRPTLTGYDNQILHGDETKWEESFTGSITPSVLAKKKLRHECWHTVYFSVLLTSL